MTRMKRNDPSYSIETGGNPLSNPYATFPEEAPTEEENEAEAKRRATELMDNFLSGKDRNSTAKMEIIDALSCDSVFVAFLNAYKEVKSCDCTATSKKYFDALQRLVKAFDEQLESEMLFNVENE